MAGNGKGFVPYLNLKVFTLKFIQILNEEQKDQPTS